MVVSSRGKRAEEPLSGFEKDWTERLLLANGGRNSRLVSLSVIHTTCSDHDPINLELLSTLFSRKHFRFKFENTWLKEPSFHEKVSVFRKGLPTSHLIPKLISVSSFMAKRGK